jgi:hypothetical protein
VHNPMSNLKLENGAHSVTTRIFERSSGAAEHYQAGNLTLVYAAVFDWLLSKFPKR